MLEILNIYKCMLWVASAKLKFTDQLEDREFLKTNILKLSKN